MAGLIAELYMKDPELGVFTPKTSQSELSTLTVSLGGQTLDVRCCPCRRGPVRPQGQPQAGGLSLPPLRSLSPLTAHQSHWPLGCTLYFTGGVQGQAAFKRPSIPPTASRTIQLNLHLRPGNSKYFFLKRTKTSFEILKKKIKWCSRLIPSSMT